MRRSPSKASPPPPPPVVARLVRLLTCLLPVLALLLLTTTVYLFHLHHAHHDAEDDSSDVRHALPDGAGGRHGAASVGGSALRHKMDLAEFLLRRYDGVGEEEARRAREEHGWRGGNEADFVRLVKEAEQGDGRVTRPPSLKPGHRPIDPYWSAHMQHGRPTAKPTPRPVGPSRPDVGKMNWAAFERLILDGGLLTSRMLPDPIPPDRTARGFSGLPPHLTPALDGARRGTITCPGVDPRIVEVMSSMLAFWNEPRGGPDRTAGREGSGLVHPFVPPPLEVGQEREPRKHRRRYMTFEPDTGGWNNQRMSLENLIILAALSGRTLVLPPDQIIYLLNAGSSDKRGNMRNYHDFFNMTLNPELLRRVPIITSKHFLAIEGGEDGLVSLSGYNATYRNKLLEIADQCEERKKSDVFCHLLYDHYRDMGQQSPVSAETPHEDCFIFDERVFVKGVEEIDRLDNATKARIEQYCGKRGVFYYNRTMHEADVWHFETLDNRYRLLTHFYGFMLFTDDKVGNYYKRFIRDFLKYKDEVFCAAGKIVLGLMYEDYVTRGNRLEVDGELVGGYSSLHIRRGDLQFKEVKFDSMTWYDNTKEIWKPDEILYVATDETKASFFEDFKKNHGGPMRFFNDYKTLASLDGIDHTYYGLIDTVVASRGIVFAGTWFSTFSGYITRLRGYYGMSKYYTYFSWLERKRYMHNWMDIWEGSLYAREYPVGWTGIDGDERVTVDWELLDEDGDIADNYKPYPRDEMDRDRAKLTEKLIAHRYDAVEEAKPGLLGSLFGAAKHALVEDKPAADNSTKSETGDRKEEPEDAEAEVAAGDEGKSSLARGVAGRKMSETPALVGAKRGHVACDADVDALAYWNDPQGDRDNSFKSPFGLPSEKPKYLVFTPDKGGFNNVRMSFEIIFILAAALDRILVLPPEQPMYLLRNDQSKKHRGLDHFFDMDGDDYKKRVKYMTMEQFVKREGHPNGQFPVPPHMVKTLVGASKVCAPTLSKLKWNGSGLTPCEFVHDYLVQHAVTPNITATHHQCLVFDQGMYETGKIDDSSSAKEFCSSGDRDTVYVTKDFQEPQLLYIQGGKPPTRMLAHYYGYLHFTDPAVGNYYKRYIRDMLHFRHEIFCSAGKIVKFLQDEAAKQGIMPDSEGAGGYSSLHIRRGDFQYKRMRVTAEEWLHNTQGVWSRNETLYIATDEKDKVGFFEPFRNAGHKLFFLDDFRELAGLDKMDPNHMGMLDVVVASRGRAFAGTFRSTFSGYINRLRGYYGMSMNDSYFGQMKEKNMMHEWHNVNFDTYAREWPDAWIGIDGDVLPSEEVF